MGALIAGATRRLVPVVAALAVLVLAAPARAADPVIMAAGDIACGSPGLTTPGDCSQMYTSDLALSQQKSAGGLAALLAVGDLQYPDGALSDFTSYFGPSWGRLASVLRPAPGNHEYHTAGASGYFTYFAGIGVKTGGAGAGYYSFDIGSWHLVSLNSSDGCSAVSCAAGSPQETWLKSDLAKATKPCILAYWHHPLSTAPAEGPIWQDLYAAGVDFVITGHLHGYQRPVARNATGALDPNGPREVVVGTGGDSGGTYGLLKMTLHATSADWEFVGSGATDSGSATCHGGPPPPPPPPPVSKPVAGFSTAVAGLTATFTDTSTNAPSSWSWDFGDETGSDQRSPVHRFAAPGTYAVKLTATNAGGFGTATGSVTVVAPPAPVVTVLAPPALEPPVVVVAASAPVPVATVPVAGRSLVLRIATSRRVLSVLRSLPLRVSGATGQPLVVTASVSPTLARRAHLHRRVLAHRAVLASRSIRLVVGPRTIAALRGARGRLAITIDVRGTGMSTGTTLTLRR